MRRLAGVGVAAALLVLSTTPAAATPATVTAASRALFRLQDARIDEASGIAVGITSPGVLYVQNDSGDAPRVFALDARTGRTLATYTVPGAKNVDWEDIAIAPDTRGVASLWIGDVGDNEATRASVTIYRVDEPHVDLHGTGRALRTGTPEVWQLSYPSGPVNAESLAVAPGGVAYIFTKSVLGATDIYAVPPHPDPTRVQTVTNLGSIRFTFTGTEADSNVLIAGGVGVTPMVSITRYLTERSWAGDIYFVFVCRTPADYMFANEIAALQLANSKLHVAVTVSKPERTDWKGLRGRITKELLTQTAPDLASRRIHLCGPPSMMDSTKAMLTELGVSPGNIKTEAFGAVNPAPAAAGTALKPTTPATGPLVKFSKNNKAAKIHVDLKAGDSPPKQTILELSEELGIGIEFSCRVGTCGICKVKMTSGEVDQAVTDALDANDTAHGIILACQAKPKGEVTVEA